MQGINNPFDFKKSVPEETAISTRVSRGRSHWQEQRHTSRTVAADVRSLLLMLYLPTPQLFPTTEQAVNRVPIFAPLSMEQKRLVSHALLEVHFRPGLYICEEVI